MRGSIEMAHRVQAAVVVDAERVAAAEGEVVVAEEAVVGVEETEKIKPVARTCVRTTGHILAVVTALTTTDQHSARGDDHQHGRTRFRHVHRDKIGVD